MNKGDYQSDMDLHALALGWCLGDAVDCYTTVTCAMVARMIRYEEAARFHAYVEQAGTYTWLPHALRGEGRAYA